MDGKLKSVVVVATSVGLIAGAFPRYCEYPRHRENCTTNCFGQSREQSRSIAAEAHLPCFVASLGSQAAAAGRM